MSSHLAFTFTPEFGASIEAVSKFFTEAKWEALSGKPFVELGKGSVFIHALSNQHANPGIVYLLFPYFGPLPGDPDYKEVFYDSVGAFPRLTADFDTGGGSPQHVDLGVAFTQASNKEAPYTSYAKLSLVVSSTGGDVPLAFKSYVHKGSNAKQYFIRVHLTRPLTTSLTFGLDYLPEVDLDSNIVASLPMLKDEYGLDAKGENHYTVTPTQKGTDALITIAAGPHTMLAGTSELYIPVTIHAAASNARHFYEFKLKNLAPRTDLKLLNNSLILAVSNHSSSNFDLAKQGLFVEMQITENGKLVANYDLGQTYRHDMPAGRAFEVIITVNCIDTVAANLRAMNNQPISSVYEPSLRHLFYQVTLRDDTNQVLDNDLESIGSGEPSVFIAGNTKQMFKFPISFKSDQTEISLQFKNLVTTMFNGYNVIGDVVGFTFNKV